MAGERMPDKHKSAQTRDRHAREIELSQAALRRSIAETERLVGESEKMLRRHRDEQEADDADD